LDLLCQLWLQRVQAVWQVVGVLLPLVNQGYPMIYFVEWGQLCHYSAQLILVFAQYPIAQLWDIIVCEFLRVHHSELWGQL